MSVVVETYTFSALVNRRQLAVTCLVIRFSFHKFLAKQAIKSFYVSHASPTQSDLDGARGAGYSPFGFRTGLGCGHELESEQPLCFVDFSFTELSY